MNINDSRRRRMLLQEQIYHREISMDKSRKSSSERRRVIQDNLNQFHKTMSNLSHNQTGPLDGFDDQHFGSTQNNQHSNLFSNLKHDIKQQYDNILRSPSFQDIHIQNYPNQVHSPKKVPQNQKENSMDQILRIVKKQSILSPNRSQQNIVFDRQNRAFHEQNIVFDQQNTGFDGKDKAPDQQIKHHDGQTIVKPTNRYLSNFVQNDSSASAILFTSQFNQFLNKNHQNNSDRNQKNLQNQIENQGLQPIDSQSIGRRQGNLTQHASKSQNDQNYTEKNLFQNVKDTNRISTAKQASYELASYANQAEVNGQINHFPDTIQQRDSKTLMKNKSGFSLAFSNQSSLKYSLNQSNIKQILNRKITNELIVHPDHFRAEDSQELLPFIRLQILSEKLIGHKLKHFAQNFLLFSKVNKFAAKVLKRQKYIYFQAFLINKQLNFQSRKNDIKCDNLLRKKKQNFVFNIFRFFKHEYFEFPLEKSQRATDFRQNTDQKTKQTIFRHFKIAWFDQKVKREIQLYYLSKLFSHFVRVVKTQKQIARNKCLSHYCHSLKKRFFKHLIQGVDKFQTERILRDNADWHYAFGLQRKVFEAWRAKLSYKERYISLAMTTKNTFKQTSDKRWLEIKTVDFRQIK